MSIRSFQDFHGLNEGKKLKDWQYTGTISYGGGKRGIYYQYPNNIKYYVEVTPEEYDDYLEGGSLKKKLEKKWADSGKAMTREEFEAKYMPKGPQGLGKYLSQGGRMWDHVESSEDDMYVEAARGWKSMEMPHLKHEVRKVMKLAKDRPAPFAVVAVKGGKVVAQDIDIKTRELIPAHYREMAKAHPDAKIHVEDAEGQSVMESVDMLPSYEVLIGLATVMGALDLAQAARGGDSIIVDVAKALKAHIGDKIEATGTEAKRVIDKFKGNSKVKAIIMDAEEEVNESLNELYGDINSLIKDLHYEEDPKAALKKKKEITKKLGGYGTSDADHYLIKYRKEIGYGKRGPNFGKDADIYMAALDNTPRSKSDPDRQHKKVNWTKAKYDKWIKDMAGNGGWQHSYDMAQNAKFEPGLLDFVKKKLVYDETPLERIQWDIEALGESLVNEAKRVVSKFKNDPKVKEIIMDAEEEVNESVNEAKAPIKDLLKTAPDHVKGWAKWVAQHKDGYWWYYDDMPKQVANVGWTSYDRDGYQWSSKIKADPKDWEKSAQRLAESVKESKRSTAMKIRLFEEYFNEAKSDITPGSRVEVAGQSIGNMGKTLQGEVTRKNSNGTYEVSLDNGDMADYKADELRLIESVNKEDYAKSYGSAMKKALNRPNFNQLAYISSAEYQKVKKLKNFNAADWKWDSKKDLYKNVRIEESVNESHSFKGKMKRDLTLGGKMGGKFDIPKKSDMPIVTFKKGEEVELEIQPNSYHIYGKDGKHGYMDKQMAPQLRFMDIDDYVMYESVNEATETGLMVVPRTNADANKIKKWVDSSDMHGEWNAREGYFLFPEDEDSFDELETELTKELDGLGVNYRIEGVFESMAQQSTKIKLFEEYFESSLDEARFSFTGMMSDIKKKEEAAMAARKAYTDHDGYSKTYKMGKKLDDLYAYRSRIMQDMEQEAEPEGGRIADQYGKQLNDLDSKISKLEGAINDIGDRERELEKKYQAAMDALKQARLAMKSAMQNESLDEASGTIAKGAYSFADYFGIPVSRLKGFKFDGTDDVEELHKVLGRASSNIKGTENIYRASITESVNEAVSYLYDPQRLIDSALRMKWITREEARRPETKQAAIDQQEEDAEDQDPDEGFGSSDFSFSLMYFMKRLGYKMDVKGGRIVKVDESVNEAKGPSKAGVKRLIKDVEEMLDTEIDANGDPLTNETEMILQKELKRLKALLRESVNEAKKSEPLFWIATKTFQSGTGRVKKGEIYQSTGKAVKRKYPTDDGEDWFDEIDVELANPRYEYYEGMAPGDFERFFRPLDPKKDTKEMKLLNNWGLVEFGEQFYIGSWSQYRGESSKETATRMLANLTPTKAESPAMAVKKLERSGGTMIELSRGITVVKKWADMYYIVFTDKTKDITAAKLINMMKKPAYTRMGKEITLLKESVNEANKAYRVVGDSPTSKQSNHPETVYANSEEEAIEKYRRSVKPTPINVQIVKGKLN